MRLHFIGKGVAIATGIILFGLVSSLAAAKEPVDPASQSSTAKKETATAGVASGHPDLTGIWVPAGQGAGIVYTKQGNTTTESIGGKANAPAPSNPNDPNDDLGRLRAAKYFSDNAQANPPHYKPEFQAKVAYLDHNSSMLYPAFYCVPRGVPSMGAPQQIIQFPDKVILLYGGTMNFRLVPIDKPHRTDADPSLMGDSVARWDGNTLVVDVNNFDDMQWLGSSGWFHTADMHVIERFTRDGDVLTYQVTVEDPSIFTEPWVRARRMKVSTDPTADALTEEGPCLEKDASHLVNHDHD
jgi:hypothetical protein